VASEQHHVAVPESRVVDAVSRTEIDAHFGHPLPDPAHVATIAFEQAVEPRQYRCPTALIPQPLEPALEGRSGPDVGHVFYRRQCWGYRGSPGRAHPAQGAHEPVARRFGSWRALPCRRCVPFCRRCGWGQQEALRGGVRRLLALMGGLPAVTVLPQVFLPTTQIGDDLTQFGHQHVGRCVAFYLSLFGRCAGYRERWEDTEKFGRLDLPLSEVVADRRDAAGLDSAQDGGLGAAGRLRGGAEGESHVVRPVRLRVAAWSGRTVNDPLFRAVRRKRGRSLLARFFGRPIRASRRCVSFRCAPRGRCVAFHLQERGWRKTACAPNAGPIS